MIEFDILGFLRWFSGIMTEVLFGVSVVLIVLYFTVKVRFISPVGRGFRNIRLPLAGSKEFKSALSFDYSVRGALVIGGAGSGKTKSIVEPLVVQAVRGGYSGIVYDFKFPSISSQVYSEALLSPPKNISYFYVNFEDLKRTHRFNVLKRVNNANYAQEYANSFMFNLNPETIKQPDFFTRSASGLLAASIFYFSRNLPKLCTLPHVLEFLVQPDTEKLVRILIQDAQVEAMVAPIRSGLASERQTAGVMSTLQNSIAQVINPNIFWVLSGDDFDLDLNNPDDPKLLAIGNKGSLVTSLSPLISLTITVATKQMNEAGKAKSIILLDEGPTLYIPNFDMIPATGRENRIATIYCAQDISQMEDRYGEKKAEVLMANLATQFYGKISNARTAERIVKLFDKEDLEYETRSMSRSERGRSEESSSRTRSFQQRERVTISHLRDLNPGEFVCSTPNLKDFKVATRHCEAMTFELPEIKHVNQRSVLKRYTEIKNDIKQLFGQ